MVYKSPLIRSPGRTWRCRCPSTVLIIFPYLQCLRTAAKDIDKGVLTRASRTLPRDEGASGWLSPPHRIFWDLVGSTRSRARWHQRELLLRRERWAKLTHDVYLIRGSVGASALFLPIRRRTKRATNAGAYDQAGLKAIICLRKGGNLGSDGVAYTAVSRYYVEFV